MEQSKRGRVESTIVDLQETCDGCAAAQALAAGVNRPAELAARYGGEEFVVLLVGASTGEAATLAEELRANVEALRIAHCWSTIGEFVTASFGAASLIPRPECEAKGLIKLADDDSSSRPSSHDSVLLSGKGTID